MLDKLASHSESVENAVLEKLKHKLLASAYRFHGPDLYELYTSMDKDSSGAISIDELTYTVKRLVPDLTDEEVERIMKTADKDGNGKLQFDEFCEFIGHRDSLTDPHNHHYRHQHYDKPAVVSTDDRHSPKVMVVDRGTESSSSSPPSSSSSSRASPATVSYMPTPSRSHFVQLETRSTSPFASNVLRNILGDDYIADAQFDDDMGM